MMRLKIRTNNNRKRKLKGLRKRLERKQSRSN